MVPTNATQTVSPAAASSEAPWSVGRLKMGFGARELKGTATSNVRLRLARGGEAS